MRINQYNKPIMQNIPFMFLLKKVGFHFQQITLLETFDFSSQSKLSC